MRKNVVKELRDLGLLQGGNRRVHYRSKLDLTLEVAELVQERLNERPWWRRVWPAYSVRSLISDIQRVLREEHDG